MSETVIGFSDVDQLRQYVIATLCKENNLEEGVFPATEKVLKRRNKPVGLSFCLHGPRKVRFMAIWETDKNSILFYGSLGQRTNRIQVEQHQLLEGQLNKAVA